MRRRSVVVVVVVQTSGCCCCCRPVGWPITHDGEKWFMISGRKRKQNDGFIHAVDTLIKQTNQVSLVYMLLLLVLVHQNTFSVPFIDCRVREMGRERSTL